MPLIAPGIDVDIFKARRSGYILLYWYRIDQIPEERSIKKTVQQIVEVPDEHDPSRITSLIRDVEKNQVTRIVHPGFIGGEGFLIGTVSGDGGAGINPSSMTFREVLSRVPPSKKIHLASKFDDNPEFDTIGNRPIPSAFGRWVVWISADCIIYLILEVANQRKFQLPWRALGSDAFDEETVQGLIKAYPAQKPCIAPVISMGREKARRLLGGGEPDRMPVSTMRGARDLSLKEPMELMAYAEGPQIAVIDGFIRDIYSAYDRLVLERILQYFRDGKESRIRGLDPEEVIRVVNQIEVIESLQIPEDGYKAYGFKRRLPESIVERLVEMRHMVSGFRGVRLV